MNAVVHLLELIITNTKYKSIQQESLLNLAGVKTDFAPWVLVVLMAVAAFLCLLNYLTLRSHRLSLAQLNSNRTFQIFVQNRSRARCVFPGWMRVVSHLLCKVGFVALAFCLTSAESLMSVYCGLILSGIFIIYNIKLLLREVLNPRSVFHRRYLLFRMDPMFVRMRLFFDLGRRFIYFVLGFAFVSYSLHRLNGQMFTVQNASVSLFVAHVQSSFTGMTSLGNDPLNYVTTSANLFQLSRGGFSFLLLLTFVNLILSGLSFSSSPKKRRSSRAKIKNYTEDFRTKDDVKNMVERIIEQHLEIPAKRVKAECDLVIDFKASSVDIAGLQAMFEEFLEQRIPPEANFQNKTRISDIIDCLWELTQKKSSHPDFTKSANLG